MEEGETVGRIGRGYVEGCGRAVIRARSVGVGVMGGMGVGSEEEVRRAMASSFDGEKMEEERRRSEPPRYEHLAAAARGETSIAEGRRTKGRGGQGRRPLDQVRRAKSCFSNRINRLSSGSNRLRTQHLASAVRTFFFFFFQNASQTVGIVKSNL